MYEELTLKGYIGHNIDAQDYGVAFKTYWKGKNFGQPSDGRWETHSTGLSTTANYISPSSKKEVMIVINTNLTFKVDLRAILPRYDQKELLQLTMGNLRKTLSS